MDEIDEKLLKKVYSAASAIWLHCCTEYGFNEHPDPVPIPRELIIRLCNSVTALTEPK